MSDLTGGQTTGRETPPRPPRVSTVRAEAERTFAGAARDGRQARLGLHDGEESLVAAGFETAEAKWRDLQKWSARQTVSSRENIRLHPFTSCAALFGVGVITGILLTRR